MWKYNFLPSLLMITTQLSLIESRSVLTSDSQPNLYKKLCFDPTEYTSKTFTLEKFDISAPKDGWFVHLGDATERFHFASVLKGETMKEEDNYGDMCFTISKSYPNKGLYAIGYFHGFGRQRAAIWSCKNSLDFPGVNRCNLYSAPPSTYYDSAYFYFTDTGREDVYVAVDCFANGEIGWLTLSTRTTFTWEDYEAVRNQVASLGFPTVDFSNTDSVTMYDDSCNSTSAIRKHHHKF